MRNFKEFSKYDWCEFILEDVSNNIKICDEYKGWELFDGWNWSYLLQSQLQPEFVDRCNKYDGWRLFNGYNWVELLRKHSQFTDKCDKYSGWELFEGYNWFYLLQDHPEFTDKCNKYNGWKLFDGWNWSYLLQNQPQFAGKCDEYNGWELLNGYYWFNLLQSHPQFADKCDEYNGWGLLGEKYWSKLLQKQPQFADRCYEYKGFNQFDKKDWKKLIENEKSYPIFLIYNLKKYKNNIYKKYHYLLDIYDNLFKDIETFKKYTDEYITTPEGFKLFIYQGIKDNRVNEIIDFEKVKDFIEGFQDLNMLMVRNILDGIIENYKNKREKENKR